MERFEKSNDDLAREVAATHPVSEGGLDRLVQRCRELRAQFGRGVVAGPDIDYSPQQWSGLLDALPHGARNGAVNRHDVFAVAKRVADGSARVRDLFTASYIWGQGNNGYGRSRYDAIVQSNPDLDGLLDSAWRASTQVDVVTAYAQLFGGYTHDGGERRSPVGDPRWSRIAHFGPAFFTKLLYFAADDRGLILDNVVANRVHELSAIDKLVDHRGRALAWSPYRYAIYLHWMNDTARAINEADSSISATPDLIELALFTSAAPTRDEGDAAD